MVWLVGSAAFDGDQSYIYADRRKTRFKFQSIYSTPRTRFQFSRRATGDGRDTCVLLEAVHIIYIALIEELYCFDLLRV